jgi:hypothetical protein
VTMADASDSSGIASDSGSIASSQASPKDVEAPNGNISKPSQRQMITFHFLKMKRKHEGDRKKQGDPPRFQTCLLSRIKKKKHQRREISNTMFY